MYKDKVILITGGTGSWGHELTRQLLEKQPKELRIFSRNELAQVAMNRKFNDIRLNFIIGDIRDKEAVEAVTKGVDYIFHLAALKHVPICEEQPQEANKTNILGTINLINYAIKNSVKKVIDVSTDKAVDPLNLYGLTKAVGEKLIIQANKLVATTRFVCIRAGNVLGSNGSVVPFFIEQIKKYNKVCITDETMTRYFMTLQEAISLLFRAAQNSFGGETFVVKMPSCRIIDLAKVLIEHYGDQDTKIEVKGKRPGEKIDEVLLSRYESENSYYYNENYYLIIPTLKIEGLNEHYGNYTELKKVDFIEYTSHDTLMDLTQIQNMLKVGGFLL
jgi:UDP-N-acetylglucosamine 4,6-dehydratase/5-epimerase